MSYRWRKLVVEEAAAGRFLVLLSDSIFELRAGMILSMNTQLNVVLVFARWPILTLGVFVL